jgi:hypothetical protein
MRRPLTAAAVLSVAACVPWFLPLRLDRTDDVADRQISMQREN